MEITESAATLAAAAEAVSSAAPPPRFSYIPEAGLKALQTCKESLTQWDLADNISYARFSFGEKWSVAEAPAFLQDLFQQPDVQHLLGFPAGAASIASLKFQPLRTKAMSMDFFDRLSESGVISATTDFIKKRLEDRIEQVAVGDELRLLLLDEYGEFGSSGSDFAGLFSEDDKQEFLYQLFRWLVLGGAMSQYEDKAAPYMEASKAFMKELLTVVKDEDKGGLRVASSVFAVTELNLQPAKEEEEGAAGGAAGGGASSAAAAAAMRKKALGQSQLLKLFPHDSPCNVCWVAIDPLKRTCSVLKAAWKPFW